MQLWSNENIQGGEVVLLEKGHLHSPLADISLLNQTYGASQLCLATRRRGNELQGPWSQGLFLKHNSISSYNCHLYFMEEVKETCLRWVITLKCL